MKRRLTAIVQREGTGYVALCPEFDVASQGDSVAEARASLEEALTPFFEVASPEELERRFKREVCVTDVEIAVGQIETNCPAVRSAGYSKDTDSLKSGSAVATSSCEAWVRPE